MIDRKFALLFCAALALQPRALAIELFVAPDNAAPADGVYASLEAARDAVRELKAQDGLPEGGVTITLQNGQYHRTAPIVLDSEDGGEDGKPIVYRAEADAMVRITGGVSLDTFRPLEPGPVRDLLVEAADHVMQCDLRAAGIDDFGSLTPRGFGRGGNPAALELFFNDTPMPLAEWPNGDWSTIADAPNGADGGLFTYEGGRPARWVNESDAWLHGYWTWDWADSYVPIASIDAESNTIHTAEPHGVYGYKKGQRFRALNVLAELDAPGEWYLDRDTGMLYFWPPKPLDDARIDVSIGTALLEINDADYVVFENLQFDQCRGTAIRVTGGSHVEIRGCTVRNIGNAGIAVSGGTHHRVQSCDIFDTGDGGISLSGGDRKTLTPANHEAVNNDIYRFSRWCRTYRPAVMVAGVGQRVAHNRIHDAPHNGIQLGGNEHVIEYNELFDLCKETGDVGAFYMGRDWTMRGVVIQYNYFHHIEGPYTHGAMAVYLDDCASGATIHGNLFYKASRAAFIGGGRDNIVTNNVFVDCHPAVHVDSRALGWAKEYALPGGGWHIHQRLDDMDHDAPPYSERYPKLATILDEAPAEPRGNRIEHNIAFNSKWIELPGTDPALVEQIDNWTEGDPGFVDAENGDFEIRTDSPVWHLGIAPLPLDKMGLQTDEYRTTVDPVHR